MKFHVDGPARSLIRVTRLLATAQHPDLALGPNPSCINPCYRQGRRDFRLDPTPCPDTQASGRPALPRPYDSTASTEDSTSPQSGPCYRGLPYHSDTGPQFQIAYGATDELRTDRNTKSVTYQTCGVGAYGSSFVPQLRRGTKSQHHATGIAIAYAPPQVPGQRQSRSTPRFSLQKPRSSGFRLQQVFSNPPATPVASNFHRTALETRKLAPSSTTAEPRLFSAPLRYSGVLCTETPRSLRDLGAWDRYSQVGAPSPRSTTPPPRMPLASLC
eukprot:1491032-Rhodomonas_salina.1